MQTTSITVTIPNPTAAQLAALTNILADVEVTTETPKKARARKGAPSKTVSKDEDEDFDGSDVSDNDEDENDEADVSDEEEGDDDSVDWDTLKAAINKYGNKEPEQMKAIYRSFNLKPANTKTLITQPKKWEPVYRKVMAKLKALKKSK